MTDEVFHPWLTRWFRTAEARQQFINEGDFNEKFDHYSSYSPMAYLKYKLEFSLKSEYRLEYKYQHHPVEAAMIKRQK